ncbi:MAG: peptidoglycan-binding protein [Clostridia bacterium]|nr:peptidoglycan-binding protein [Clostridia bacterium]
MIRRGSRGEYVTLMQTMLVNRGYDIGSTGVDGDFGIRTERAVELFQRANGLTVDGIVGPTTWAALDDVPDTAVTAALYEIRIGGLTKDQVTELLKEYPKADVIEERSDSVV